MSQAGGTLRISSYVRDGHACIEVRDSGVGIAENSRELIFEPFYTTKPEVQGTGLGLSISYGIIAGHGGEITVSSEVDRGSSFTVQLPVHPLKN